MESTENEGRIDPPAVTVNAYINLYGDIKPSVGPVAIPYEEAAGGLIREALLRGGIDKSVLEGYVVGEVMLQASVTSQVVVAIPKARPGDSKRISTSQDVHALVRAANVLEQAATNGGRLLT